MIYILIYNINVLAFNSDQSDQIKSILFQITQLKTSQDQILDMQRQDRQDNYHKKKNKDQKGNHKKEYSNQDEKAMIEKIRNSSMESLLSFLQNKYDRDKISKFYNRVNNEIIKKLQEFKNDFKKKSIQRIINLFKKHANINLSQNIAKIFFQEGGIQSCLNDIPDMDAQVKKGLHSSFVYINWKKYYLNTFNLTFNLKRPDVLTKCIYCGDAQQYIYFAPAHKRIQKEGIEILQKFIQLQSVINSHNDK